MSVPVIDWVRPGVGLVPAAAASFRRAEADLGRQIDCNSSYRDYARQLSMHLASLAYMSGRGPYPGHSYAVHPDYSAHCRGVGLDSDDWTRPGFITFMAERGWIRTAAGDLTERHHFEYQWWMDQHRNRPATGGGWAPFVPEEDDMQLTDRILVRGGTASVTVSEALARAFDVYDAIFVGGISMPDNGRPLKDSMAGVVQVVDRISAQGSNPVVVDIDEAAVAAALAPLLPRLGELSDADVARFAVAAADENARRLSQRASD